MNTKSDRMLIKYYLKFDSINGVGSSEHFFHFMWGYLLPALNEIMNIESDFHSKRISKKYIFMSCGPVMDDLTNEMLSLYNCNYEIIDKSILDIEEKHTKILVPRWDTLLKDFITIKYTQFISSNFKSIFTARPLENLLLLLKQKKVKSDLLASILKVKANIVHKIDNSFSTSNININTDSYLILKRSPQPKYYDKEGKADIPTYGTARRELLGIEDAVQYLRNKNISVTIFEPGRHTLSEQIKVFQNCKGVVGIKGAEFANIIWMKPKSKVILIQPLSMGRFPFQKSLANLLGLNYYEITTNESMYPTLSSNLILNYLK